MSERIFPAADTGLPINSRVADRVDCSFSSNLETKTMSRRNVLEYAFGGAATVSTTTMASMVAAADLPSASDEELCSLRQPFLKAWAAERELDLREDSTDKEYDDAGDRVSSVVDKIESLEASTLKGLKMKALALSWTHGGHPVQIDVFDEYATTDMRLIWSIVSDLLRLAGCKPPKGFDPLDFQ